MAGVGISFANRTVYAEIILTDEVIADVLGRDFHRVPEGVNGTAKDNALRRHKNAQLLASELPFHVDFWYLQ